MKKSILLLIFLVSIYHKVSGQNLLFNNGFEEHFNCPSGCTSNYGRISNNVLKWKGSFGAGYLHYCADNQCPYWLSLLAPNSAFGYQYPLTDSAYISLYAGYGFGQVENRDFAFQKMRQPLQLGKKYWVEYFTSLGDSANYAVTAFGATFCMDTLNLDQPIANNQFKRPFKLENTGEVLSDKIRWTPLHWVYEADSAYQTFLMGYARGLGQWDTVFVGSSCYWCTSNSNRYSFYFFDDAGVFPIISNNQQIKACSFPKVLQGPTESGITFREWKKDTVVLPLGINQTINQTGIYTLTWRTDTTVHIDTFFVEADIPIANFLGLDVPWQTGQQVVLAAPMGYSYLWSTTETSQTITCDTAGIYSVIVTNAFNCSYSDALEVYDVTAVKDLEEDWGVEVFPNPAGEVVTIKVNEVVGGGTPTTGGNGLVGDNPPRRTTKGSRQATPSTGGKQAAIMVEIYSADGRMIKEAQFNGSYTLDVSEYANGIYFIKLGEVNKNRMPVVRRLVVNR